MRHRLRDILGTAGLSLLIKPKGEAEPRAGDAEQDEVDRGPRERDEAVAERARHSAGHVG